eukprot:CAMPEP_0185804402 /NCGR_PEP_ID=MMETSP1322-20130828/3232_1 /TAXON_ID=265543 /ORGANISM="Minutocellus polymorphus, Strain RCC2270" /LENGTH=55 /DNA_ID=CAMNT_0028500371 /DNA_START=63 /DNA_END=230 /DNA_ORIENTATION=+
MDSETISSPVEVRSGTNEGCCCCADGEVGDLPTSPPRSTSKADVGRVTRSCAGGR